MRVRVTPEAQAQLEKRKRWWREHREKAPDLFDREFMAATERIGSSPTSLPVFAEKRRRSIRRCLMPKTECHLYFEIFEERQEIWVVAAAGGRRATSPRLRLQDASR